MAGRCPSSRPEIYRRTGHGDWAATEDALEAKLPKPNCAAARSLECDFAAGRFLPLAIAAKPRLTAESFYWQAKAYDALARDAFTKLAALPESVEVHQLLAEMHRDQGRHPEAVAEWQAALKLKKGDPALRRELAASLFATKDYENAQAMLTGLLAAEPASADLNFLQGDLLLAEQQAGPAIPFLEKAAAAEPRLLAARAALGRALLQSGRPADAIPHLKASIPADTDGALYFQLARAHQAAGQESESKAAMAKYQQIRVRSGAA